MKSEHEKLVKLLSAGLISQSEFRRAQQMVRASQPVDPLEAQSSDLANSQEPPALTERFSAPNLPESSDAPGVERPLSVAAIRPRSGLRVVVGLAAAVGAVVLGVFLVGIERPNSPSSVELVPPPAAAQIMLTDQGISPFAWGSTQPQVLAWLRDQLGPEQLLIDVADPEMCGGATVSVTWVDGYSFYVTFSSRGLLGYRLADGPSTDRSVEALARFVGPSGLAVRSSLEDIREALPQVTLWERQDDPGWPNRVRAFIGGQMLELSDDTFDVWAISAGRSGCSSGEIDPERAGVPVTIDGDGRVVRVETPVPSSPSVEPEGITLHPDGLGDVPFGSHPDIILSWVAERLGPPTDRWENRDLGCPSGMIADAKWDGLTLYFFRGWAEEDSGFTGPGFAPSDTFGGYWHNPTSVTPDAPAGGVFMTPEGIGPGVTLAAVLDAYPDAAVFDAVKAGQDGSPYGDRPPSFRTPSGFSGELTGTNPDSLVVWVSGGTDICGD